MSYPTDALSPFTQCRTPLHGRSRIIADYVTLIIGYKNESLVADVLSQLATQTVQPLHVVIVDNGGTFDETERLAWPLAHISTLISRPDNPGYAAAVNLGRDYVHSTDSLLVLTHDARFDTRLAESLLQGLQQPAAGSAAPILHFANQPDRIFSAGGKLSRTGRATHLTRPSSPAPYTVDWVDGAIVMYSVAALAEIDWLDENYFLYFEDVDTGFRLSNAGWVNVIVPTVVAFQEPGAHPQYLGMRNMALFARKAGVSRLRHLTAVLPRMARESASRLRRGLAPELFDACRGLRDGYRGRGGRVE